MRISVVIPTYNSSGFIQATLDSVLQQTLSPEEILVLDDGSTDDTVAVLNTYRPRITVLTQKNAGVAAARNRLCRSAQGDLIAFLDHDDLWHPDYLRIQAQLWKDTPQIVASFTGHIDFFGHERFSWTSNPFSTEARKAVLDPVAFLNEYNDRSGLFGSASFLCVSRAVVQLAGEEPFSEEVSGVDDSYFCTILPLLGSVVFCSTPLVAYRITAQAQSTNKMKAFQMWVHVFRLLEHRYMAEASPELVEAFQAGFASKRRQYAKRLMGAGKTADARSELWQSLNNYWSWRSHVKSLSLLAFTFLPTAFQPRWPSPYREALGASL